MVTYWKNDEDKKARDKGYQMKSKPKINENQKKTIILRLAQKYLKSINKFFFFEMK